MNMGTRFLSTRAGKWSLSAFIVFIFILIGLSGNDDSSNLNTQTSDAANTQINSSTSSTKKLNEAKIASVVDGDTVDLEDGTRIRIVGIDTPETVDPRKPVQCFGIEASNKMKELVMGKVVGLEKDTVGDTVDKYGRKLYYITLAGVDVGAKMIEDGYAYAYTSYPHVKNDAYVALEKQAREAKRGLWAERTCAGNANTNTTTSSTNTSTTTATNKNINTATTVAPAPSPSESCNCSTDLDCGDFSSHAAAQETYICCMQKVGYDFHKLDGNDNDGLACESLP